MKTPLNLPQPPEWALNVGILGRALIVTALCGFVLAIVLWALCRSRPQFSRWAKRSFVVGCCGLFGAFVSLGTLLVTRQYEFRYVYQHVDNATELQYRIAGLWAGQEGSFLLWGVTSSIFALLAMRRAGAWLRPFGIAYATFLGIIAAIGVFESPFVLQFLEGQIVKPPDGTGLVPSLHNYWVTIHPPTIFLGFGSLTVLFCMTLASLVQGDLADWARRIRPWAIVSATLLGLGLCMGGLWAYETLGWGGFWAWDPVENVSFVPWAITIALIHGLFVQVARGKWAFTNAMLGGLGFISFVYGTFLTRSGLLADVSKHSFAQMDRSALRLLFGMLILGVLVFGAAMVRRWRIDRADAQAARPHQELPLNRTFAYSVAICVLLILAFGAAFGMSVPVVMALFGRSAKVVDEKLYHLVLVWPMLALLVAMAVGPVLSWRGIGFKALAARMSNVLAVSLALLGVALFWIKHPLYGVDLDPAGKINTPFGFSLQLLPWMGLLIFLSIFALVANIWQAALAWRRSRSSMGAFTVHLGVIVLLAGLIISRGFERSEKLYVQEGRPAQALGYTISYKGPTGSYFNRNNRVEFEMVGQNEAFSAFPGLYYVPKEGAEPEPEAWPGIHRSTFHDLYLTLGAMVFDATGILTFKPGESKLFENEILITYRKIVRQGTPGQTGTKFGALLTIKTPTGTTSSTPMMELGAQGPIVHTARITDDLIATMQGMDAADKSVRIQLHYSKPLFPIELFYKPMTGLVWLGMGIMTLGGFLAAISRARASRGYKLPPPPAEEPSIEHAPPTAAQV